MKAIGVVRKVDELGRIVIPVELRKNMDIEVKDSLEIYTEDNCIILKKYEPSCIFCGEAKDIIQFNGKNVCKHCIEEIVRRIHYMKIVSLILLFILL